MKVATIQMQIVEGDPSLNREKIISLLESASVDADLYLAPELWSSGYCHEQWKNIAETDTVKTIDWMSVLAKKLNAWFGGSVIYKDKQGHLYNRFVLFNRQGQQVGYYDKSHLFPVMKEDQYLHDGRNLFVVDIEGFKFSAAICYDLRFPEMFRRLALQGVDVFLVPSEWPASRQDILVTLSAARAIESQAYLILSNRCGYGQDGQRFAGKSAIFGPQGVVCMAEGDNECVVVSDIDKQVLIDAREGLGVLSHRMAGVDYEVA